MKKEHMNHLFVPLKKSIVERMADAIGDKLSALFHQEKSQRKPVKEIKDKVILYAQEQK